MNSLNHLEDLKNFGVLPQRFYNKNRRTILTIQFWWKEKKYGKISVDKQVELNLNKSEDENQRGEISNSLWEMFEKTYSGHVTKTLWIMPLKKQIA